MTRERLAAYIIIGSGLVTTALCALTALVVDVEGQCAYKYTNFPGWGTSHEVYCPELPTPLHLQIQPGVGGPYIQLSELNTLPGGGKSWDVLWSSGNSGD